MNGWRLRRLPVCGSTEWELERWLEELTPPSGGLQQRLAVVAARQRHGHGQCGRVWTAPLGGLWLSAAFPWPAAAGGTVALALVVGLARQLEALGLPVQIKWPNDLLLHRRKLAGLLPRLRWRGASVRWAQAGIGLNGVNRLPAGAIGVAEALAPPGSPRPLWHPQATPRRLEPRVLAGLDWAMAHGGEAERLRSEAEARLWRPAEGLLLDGECWHVDGLEQDGRLRLQRVGQRRWLRRSF